MDFIYIAGFMTVCGVFAYFAINTSAKRNPIMRNVFFLACLTMLFLVANISVQTAKVGDWVVNSTTLDVATNTTAYTYIQKAPSVNPADLDNIFLVLSTVIWLVFAYVLIQMILNTLDWVMRSLKGWGRSEEDDDNGSQ